MCRWTIGAALVDIMPSEERVLGFGNRWYPEAIRSAELFSLPSGRTIKLITAPLFLATKLQAFGGRGHGDYQASHDLEDIVALVDGRPEIVHETAASTGALRDYLVTQIAALPFPVDPIQIEPLRVEDAANPADHVFMLFVVTVADDLQEQRIAMWATYVIRRAGIQYQRPPLF